MSSEQQEREKFENAWVAGLHPDVKAEWREKMVPRFTQEGWYADKDLEIAWTGWRLARAAPPAQPAAGEAIPHHVLKRLSLALNGMLTQFGMDEDEDSRPTFDRAREAWAEAQLLIQASEEAHAKRQGFEWWDRLCALPRFSFILAGNSVRRLNDASGNWVELSAAQQIVDDAQAEINVLRATPQPAQVAEPVRQVGERSRLLRDGEPQPPAGPQTPQCPSCGGCREWGGNGLWHHAGCTSKRGECWLEPAPQQAQGSEPCVSQNAGCGSQAGLSLTGDPQTVAAQGSESGEAVHLSQQQHGAFARALANSVKVLHDPAANDQRDAARYRFMRLHNTCVRHLTVVVADGWAPADLDAAIDRAIEDQATSPETTVTNPNARPPAPPLDPSLRQAAERDILDQKARDAAQQEQPKPAPPGAPTKEK